MSWSDALSSLICGYLLLPACFPAWTCLFNLACAVQLAIDNVLAPYLGNQFGFSITKAANLAAIFGMLNFVARPLGGYLSDVCGRRYSHAAVASRVASLLEAPIMIA